MRRICSERVRSQAGKWKQLFGPVLVHASVSVSYLPSMCEQILTPLLSFFFPLLTFAFQASISTDSHLRIYTSLQPTPTDWQLTSSVSLPTLTLPSGSGSTQPHANLPAEDYPNSLTTSGTPVNNAMPQQGLTPGKGNEAMGGWSLSWCKEKWWGQVLAVTSGHSGIVKVNDLPLTLPYLFPILVLRIIYIH